VGEVQKFKFSSETTVKSVDFFTKLQAKISWQQFYGPHSFNAREVETLGERIPRD